MLNNLFGESPFEHLVSHARKVHECVALIKPIAVAIAEGDMEKINSLQLKMSEMEYEADGLKDEIRKNLPSRFLLPVKREDIAGFLKQLDRLCDDAEDFAVIATFRKLDIPQEYQKDFLALVEKVVEASESLLSLAEHLAQLQREDFSGTESDATLDKIQLVCRLEWESDKLNREFARKYYSNPPRELTDILLLDKLCRALGSIADHAENVGKNLRLMIMSRK
jgi:predicted phosphate transport protein (TIGR00153 family)